MLIIQIRGQSAILSLNRCTAKRLPISGALLKTLIDVLVMSIIDLIYTTVHRIPAGQVATYGQIARLIGRPNHARQVGYALASLDADDSTPWHRVVNAKGQISHRTVFECEDYQRVLLEDEGIQFDVHDRIDLSRYQWQPGLTD